MNRLSLLIIIISTAFVSGCEHQKLLSSHQRPKKLQVEDISVGSAPLNWNNDEFDAFARTVGDLIKKRDFESLNAMAADLRETKARFDKGGGWKIHSYYRVTSSPEEFTDDGWNRHIRFLEDWKAAMPYSMAARVSLADTLIGYAWSARGTGYAHEVTPEARPIFESRIERAAEELWGASQLEERCYGYFETLLGFARPGGFHRSQFEGIFAEAIAYDNTYQYFYTEKAQYLLTRWHGKPGDAEAFAEDLLHERGLEEGLKLYYLIAAELHIYKWEQDFYKETGLSWKKAKKGFVLFEKDHGPTRYRVNEFAHMAYQAKDPQATCNTFRRLQGMNDFDSGFWVSREVFENQKKIALDFMCLMPRADNQAE